MSEHKPLGYDEASYTVRVDSDQFGQETRRIHDHLTRRVIGQDRAARRLVRGRAIFNAGLLDDKGCAGAYLFAGPTGVGKTLMAEELARALIADTPDAPITRIQCGKYKESHRVSELVGAPPSYVGFDREPLLSQMKIDEPHFMAKLRSVIESISAEKRPKQLSPRQQAEMYLKYKPYHSVILFDEVEKAHPDLWNHLLHIIDDGTLVMGNGEKSDFSNSIIVLTCNVGGRRQQELLSGKDRRIGFGNGLSQGTREHTDGLDQQIYDETVRLIEQIFAPELVGRLRSEIVVFRALTEENCAEILELLLKKVNDKFDPNRGKSIPITVQYSRDVKQYLLRMGIDQVYGIRPLKKTVHKYITLKLANAIEAGGLIEGDEVMFKMADGVPEVFRKHRPPPPPPKRRVYVEPPKPTSDLPRLPAPPGHGPGKKDG